jgi:hypothetical protein
VCLLYFDSSEATFAASVVVHLSKFVAAPSVSRLQLLIMARRASLKTAQVLCSCKIFLIETRWCAFHKTVLQLLQNNNKRKTHSRIFVLGGPVIDASTAVCQYLTGTSSCGWSDKFSITATVTSDSRPNGPY